MGFGIEEHRRYTNAKAIGVRSLQVLGSDLGGLRGGEEVASVEVSVDSFITLLPSSLDLLHHGLLLSGRGSGRRRNGLHCDCSSVCKSREDLVFGLVVRRMFELLMRSETDFQRIKSSFIFRLSTMSSE